MAEKGLTMRSAMTALVLLAVVVAAGVRAEPPSATTRSATSQPAVAPNAPPLPPGSLPKELTLDLGKKVRMKLVLIPAGEFTMGSPKNEPGSKPTSARSAWSRSPGRSTWARRR